MTTKSRNGTEPANQPAAAKPQPSKGQVRVSLISVQLSAFLDTGDELLPLQTQPVVLKPSEFAAYDLQDHVAKLQESVDAAPAE